MALSDFEKLLKAIDAHSVIDTSITKDKHIPLDLSIHNKALQTVDCTSSKALETFIWNYMVTHNAKVAYGGYLEPRDIYQRSQHFNPKNVETDRNIHLGLDLWIETNTPIYAPINGVVHSFKNNTNFGDYGPTIILKHKVNQFQFYTLYGHLSLESIVDKTVGDPVKQGEQIASLGNALVNGDYPPHLHFQIIKDIGEYNGDYPGVCSKKDVEFYKQNCPNPSLLLFKQ